MGLRVFSLLFALALAFAPVMAYAVTDAKASPHQTTTPESATSTDDPAGPAAATNEADAPHAAAEEHGEGGLPQLNFGTYPSQIFWLLVMFAVLYTVFAKSTLPMIGAVVHGRENMIKGNLEAAQRLKDEAQAIQTAYEKNLDAAKAQAVQAVQDVENAAKKKASDQIDVFRKRAETEMGNAEERVLKVKDKAMGDMAHVAAEVASIAAEKITGINTDVQKAKAIVDSIAGKAKAA